MMRKRRLLPNIPPSPLHSKLPLSSPFYSHAQPLRFSLPSVGTSDLLLPFCRLAGALGDSASPLRFIFIPSLYSSRRTNFQLSFRNSWCNYTSPLLIDFFTMKRQQPFLARPIQSDCPLSMTYEFRTGFQQRMDFQVKVMFFIAALICPKKLMSMSMTDFPQK